MRRLQGHAARCATSIAVAVAVLAAARIAAAETIIVGGNIINETWTAAESPYIVQGDITIPPEATLAIEAGAVVQFASSDDQASGTDTDRVELIVGGTLRVDGSAEQAVRFEGSTASPGSWYGLIIAPGPSWAAIRHLHIRHARNGLSSLGNHHGADIAHVRIEAAQTYGVYVNGALTADSIEVIGNPFVGVFVAPDSSAVLTNCLVQDNLYGISNRGRLTVDHCTIHSNSYYGIQNAGSSYNTTIAIKSSIVSGPGQDIGVMTQHGLGPVTIEHSNVWGNRLDLERTSLGTGSFSANPLYVSDTDLRLTSRSPSRLSAQGETDQGGRPFDGALTTELRGWLWESTTLAGGEVHTVTGDLVVPPGRTLTIEPGAVLQFAATDSMASGSDTTRAELRALGALRVEGSAEHPVSFESSTASPGSWYGLVFAPGASSATIRHLRIRHTRNGLSSLGDQYGADIAHVRIEDAQSYGIYVSGALRADSVAVVGNPFVGVYVAPASSAVLTNCLVQDNLYGISNRGRLTVDHCTIHSNSYYGVQNAGNSYNTTIAIKNSIVSGPGQDIGVMTQHGLGPVTIEYSNVWGNRRNLERTSLGTGSFSANPLYVSDTDLRLQRRSRCIDAASGPMDHDILGTARPVDGDGIGAVAPDMGAYELTRSATCATCTSTGPREALVGPVVEPEADSGCQAGAGTLPGAAVLVLGMIAAMRRRHRSA